MKKQGNVKILRFSPAASPMHNVHCGAFEVGGEHMFYPFVLLQQIKHHLNRRKKIQQVEAKFTNTCSLTFFNSVCELASMGVAKMPSSGVLNNIDMRKNTY